MQKALLGGDTVLGRNQLGRGQQGGLVQGEVPFQEGIQGRPVVRRCLSCRGHE